MHDRGRATIALALNTLAFTVCFACWMLNGVLVTYLVENQLYRWTDAQLGWLIGIPVLSGALTSMGAPYLLRWLTGAGQELEAWRALPRIYAGALVAMTALFALLATPKKVDDSHITSFTQRFCPRCATCASGASVSTTFWSSAASYPWRSGSSPITSVCRPCRSPPRACWQPFSVCPPA